MEIDRKELTGNWGKIRDTEKCIRDDLTKVGIVAIVDFYTSTDLEFHIIFGSEGDKNLYKLVGAYKEDGDTLKFRISPGIVSVLGDKTGLSS